MADHTETCRMVTAKLLTGTDRDCDCGVAYDDLVEEADTARADLAEVVALLKKIEWAPLGGYEQDTPYCPCCTNWESVGHAPDCVLAKHAKGSDGPGV